MSFQRKYILFESGMCTKVLPESSERAGILVHCPFCVNLHSYTKPVFFCCELVRVPLGAPTIKRVCVCVCVCV